jgi:hypothetical protein
VLDRKLTTVLFASKSPVVLTGDDTGNVNVYKMQKIQLNTDIVSDKQSTTLATIMAAKHQHGVEKPM